MLPMPSSKENNHKSNRLDQWAIGISLITLVISGFAIYQSYESIQLQNISLNFNPRLVPYVVEANLGIFNVTKDTAYFLSNYGNLTLSLIVITPHALILNISDPRYGTSFTYRNSTTPVNGRMLPVLDQNKNDSNMVIAGPLAEPPSIPTFPSAVYPFFQQYEAFVQPGVIQVNFTIPVFAIFSLNPKVFTESGQAGPFGFATSLANFKVYVKVFDVQTEQSRIEEYSGTLDVWINGYPPFL